MEILGREYEGVTIPGPWASIGDIRAANQLLGDKWFSASAMAFFQTRFAGLYFGRFFLTSEKDTGPRRYTIRIAYDDGKVETVGEFMGYSTPNAAEQEVRRIADGKGE